jgi:hypothetical protein
MGVSVCQHTRVYRLVCCNVLTTSLQEEKQCTRMDTILICTTPHLRRDSICPCGMLALSCFCVHPMAHIAVMPIGSLNISTGTTLSTTRVVSIVNSCQYISVIPGCQFDRANSESTIGILAHCAIKRKIAYRRDKDHVYRSRWY